MFLYICISIVMTDIGDEKGNLADIRRLETADREFSEQEGYIVEATADVDAANHKIARDGHTILVPQPSDFPEDPLNWSPFKKHLILFIISLTALLPDYGSAVGAVTLIPQAEIWKITPDTVNHSQVGNVFMLGAGGVVVVALSAYFGRLPLLFWFLIVGFATAAWCAGAHSFESFMAARILNGFFVTVAQGGGLMFINDMFFFHERARKINIWAAFIILSPYLGPLLAAFMITTQSWTVPFWVYTALVGICVVLTIAFVPETYYNRKVSPHDVPSNGNRILTLTGVHQRRVNLLAPNTIWDAILRPLIVLIKPTVFLSCIYYMLTFAWVVGINTTLSIFVTPLYNFGPLQIGYFYFTPIVAAILGEIAGHFLHDAFAKAYIRKHNGHFEPEVRLRITFISTPLMVAGLVLIGFSLERAYHYMVTAVAWGLYVFGTMITTTAVSAYNLDSYPIASGEVAAWVNFSRTIGGFIISYFQVRWAESAGTIDSFGTQAGILSAAWLIALLLMVFGKKLRIMGGQVHFKTI